MSILSGVLKGEFKRKKFWLNVREFFYDRLHIDLDILKKKDAVRPFKHYSFSRYSLFSLCILLILPQKLLLTLHQFNISTLGLGWAQKQAVCGSCWTHSPEVFGQWPGNELWPRTLSTLRELDLHDWAYDHSHRPQTCSLAFKACVCGAESVLERNCLYKRPPFFV